MTRVEGAGGSELLVMLKPLPLTLPATEIEPTCWLLPLRSSVAPVELLPIAPKITSVPMGKAFVTARTTSRRTAGVAVAGEVDQRGAGVGVRAAERDVSAAAAAL